MVDPILIELLTRGIDNNDSNEAVAAAKLIAMYKNPGDELCIQSTDPKIEYRTDNSNRPSALGISKHKLFYKRLHGNSS
jgi:hypothetical protein